MHHPVCILDLFFCFHTQLSSAFVKQQLNFLVTFLRHFVLEKVIYLARVGCHPDGVQIRFPQCVTKDHICRGLNNVFVSLMNWGFG